MYIKTGTEIRPLEDKSQGTQISTAEQQDKSNAEKTRESENSQATVSSQGDLLSISKEGLDTSSQMKNQPDLQSQAQTDRTVIYESAEGKVTKLESDVSTINLSRYTETELSQMYRNGDITKAEYDEEISSREA